MGKIADGDAGALSMVRGKGLGGTSRMDDFAVASVVDNVSLEAFEGPGSEFDGPGSSKYVISGSVDIEGDAAYDSAKGRFSFFEFVKSGQSYPALPHPGSLPFPEARELAALRVLPESLDEDWLLMGAEEEETLEDEMLDLPLLCFFSPSFAFIVSGIPSHFEFTFGTVAGSFCDVIPARLWGFFPPFSAASLRCCFAYCSNAD